MKNTFWNMLEKHPPGMVRLLARRKVGVKQVVALTDEEIALAAEIPLEGIRRIYLSAGWDDIPLGKIRRYLQACNFDPTSPEDRNRVSAYLRQPGGPRYVYLKESPLWKTLFKPLICHLNK